jgi:hypothetical protein
VNIPMRLCRMGLIFVALFFLACIAGQDGVNISSTSISTGNPVGITFRFEKEAKPVALTGTLDIYASMQIPVPGYSPEPLLRMRLDNSDTARLAASALASIPDTLWPDDPDGKDSLLKFNVVLTGDSLGAILKGFRFDKRHKVVIPPAASDAEETFHAEVSGLVDYAGVLELDSGYSTHRYDYYIFIFGTGYFAKMVGDKSYGDTLPFTLSKLPAGQHDAFLLGLPNPAVVQTSYPDSAAVFTLTPPLRTDTDSLRTGLYFMQVRLPPGYFLPK